MEYYLAVPNQREYDIPMLSDLIMPGKFFEIVFHYVFLFFFFVNFKGLR